MAEYKGSEVSINVSDSFDDNYKFSSAEKRAIREVDEAIDKMHADFNDFAKCNFRMNQTQAEIAANANKYNSSVTANMLLSMASPFVNNGLSKRSFFEAFMMKYIIERMTGTNLDECVAKYEADMYNSLSNSDHKNAHGLRKFLKDDYMHRTNKNIEDAVKNNTMENLVMTPFQVATMKCNFDRQCYAEYRKCNTMLEIKEVEDRYNRAIATVKEIAENSGFDMSVVAKEERFIVGMEIKKNPDYANIYYETYDMGAEPDNIYDRKNGTWNGSFKTADGGVYTVGGHKDRGAFTPRYPFGCITVNTPDCVRNYVSTDGRPLDMSKPIDRFKEQCAIKAKEWGSIINYVKSEDSLFPKELQQAIISKTEKEIAFTRDRMISAMRDDNVIRSEAQGRAVWDDAFGRIYDEMSNKDSRSSDLDVIDPEISSDGEALGLHLNVKDKQGRVIKGFVDKDGKFNDGEIVTKSNYRTAVSLEIKRILVKDVLSDAHIDYGNGSPRDMLRIRHNIGEYYKRVYQQNGEDWKETPVDDGRYRIRDISGEDDAKQLNNQQDKFGQIMLDQLVERRLKSMSADQVVSLFRHAVTNVDQGRKLRNGVPGRIKEEDCLTNNFDRDRLVELSAIVDVYRPAQNKLDSKNKGSIDKVLKAYAKGDTSDTPAKDDDGPVSMDEYGGFSPDDFASMDFS